MQQVCKHSGSKHSPLSSPHCALSILSHISPISLPGSFQNPAWRLLALCQALAKPFCVLLFDPPCKPRGQVVLTLFYREYHRIREFKFRPWNLTGVKRQSQVQTLTCCRLCFEITCVYTSMYLRLETRVPKEHLAGLNTLGFCPPISVSCCFMEDWTECLWGLSLTQLCTGLQCLWRKDLVNWV
jgi:hypothetical protein